MGPIFFFVSVLSLTSLVNSMIITSVLGGPKKYKTASFDLLPFPLVWSVPNKLQFAFRGYQTFRRPFFNVNMATPVSLPLDFLPPRPEYSSDTAEYASPTEETTDLAPDQSEAEDTISQIPDQKKEYVGYDSDSNIPRPYTGKAQVSSFIDNGQFVHANSGTNSASQDAAFGDDTDRRVNGGPPDTLNRRFGKIDGKIKKGKTVALLGAMKKKGKTVALGYETLGEPNKQHNPIKTHNMHPDSMPWGMDYEGWQKYYTTFQVTFIHRHLVMFFNA